MRFLKKYSLLIIMSMFVGFFMGFREIKVDKNLLIIFVVAIFVISLVFTLYKWIKLIRLIGSGNYLKAIDYSNALLIKYKNKKSLTTPILLNIANCYNRMGDFRKSIEILDKIDTKNLDGNRSLALAVAYGSNSILLEENINIIKMYFDKTLTMTKLIEYYPLFANYEALVGNKDAAAEYIETYIHRDNHKKLLLVGKDLFIFDKFSIDIENNFSIGLYYFNIGDSNLAKDYFKKSANCKYDNYYSQKSIEFLTNLTI
jgi:tetratricopeptide (TPR) repeat protein